MGISYQPLKRKHNNFNLFSTNFDILKEMDLKYALAFLLVGFILSVNGQDVSGPEGRPEQTMGQGDQPDCDENGNCPCGEGCLCNDDEPYPCWFCQCKKPAPSISVKGK